MPEQEAKPKREFISTVYIVKDRKVLLNMNQKLRKFVPLGGHIEENELPCESAIREAKEESGFDIELINPKAPNIRNLPPNFDIGLDIVKPDHHHINLSYIGKIKGGTQLKSADDNTELRWFSEEEVKNLDTFENVKQAALKAIKLAA
jgi:ADP-ribose pyrophosphatase YjhB (NUDIX family)